MFSNSAESSTSVFFWNKQVSVVGIFEDGVNIRQSFKITLHNYIYSVGPTPEPCTIPKLIGLGHMSTTATTNQPPTAAVDTATDVSATTSSVTAPASDSCEVCLIAPRHKN